MKPDGRVDPTFYHLRELGMTARVFDVADKFDRRRVNRNEGRTVRRVLGYNGNGAHFRRTTDEVAQDGYREFAFR